MDVLPAVAEPELERTIGEELISLGDLGLADVKLTDKEEAILNEPVPEAEVLLKPHKAYPPAYLSHPSYTRWFNRAFGRLGWSLVPASKPLTVSGQVVCAYLLHIHGKPVALAWGEQDYFENNKNQSYGDALESTVASALRRCAKRLGVGLELWDKTWTTAFHARHPEMYLAAITSAREQDERRGGGQQRQEPRRERSSSSAAPAGKKEETAGHHRQSAEPITEPQAKRLYAITMNSGRAIEEVSAWLERRYGFKKSRDITRDKYDDVVKHIEADADLPQGRA
jgi:hypothetical protein